MKEQLIFFFLFEMFSIFVIINILFYFVINVVQINGASMKYILFYLHWNESIDLQREPLAKKWLMSDSSLS